MDRVEVENNKQKDRRHPNNIESWPQFELLVSPLRGYLRHRRGKANSWWRFPSTPRGFQAAHQFLSRAIQLRNGPSRSPFVTARGPVKVLCFPRCLLQPLNRPFDMKLTDLWVNLGQLFQTSNQTSNLTSNLTNNPTSNPTSNPTNNQTNN